jgi:hypothetical protein
MGKLTAERTVNHQQSTVIAVIVVREVQRFSGFPPEAGMTNFFVLHNYDNRYMSPK